MLSNVYVFDVHFIPVLEIFFHYKYFSAKIAASTSKDVAGSMLPKQDFKRKLSAAEA